MQVGVHEVGRSKSKIVVIDDFLANAQAAVDAAAALPAFPPESRTGYPGRRHQIGPADKASSCVMEVLSGAGPVIQRNYGADYFRVLEASFSLVTTPPEALSPRQRIPHYDWDAPDYLALLLHLHHVPDTGTAFYRHVGSNIERVGEATAPALRELVQAELAEPAADPEESTHYQQIFQVAGHFNRLVIYQGCLIHSGYFPPDFSYSGDPRAGRLTANIFIQTVNGRV